MKKYMKKMVWLMMFSFFLLSAGVSAQAVSKVKITDANFSQEMIKVAREADTNKDNAISKKEATKVTKIKLASNRNADIFKGLKYFTNIKKFVYTSNKDRRNPEQIGKEEISYVQELDLYNFKRLTKVKITCDNNYLKKVNLKECTNLKDLCISDYPSYNPGDPSGIKSLNLKGCKNLEKLDCLYVKVENLDLSGLKKLKEVYIKGADTVNLTKASGLKTLGMRKVKKVQLKGANNLEGLYIEDGYMKTLDVSNKKKLKVLECSNSYILEELDVTGCKELKNLNCRRTSIKTLSLKTNTKLEKLVCFKTKLTKLNLKKNKKLKILKCFDTDIRALDLSNTRIKDEEKVRCDKDVSIIFAMK